MRRQSNTLQALKEITFAINLFKLLSMFVRAFILIMASLFANPNYGHGDLHERIQKVSKEIKSHPDSAFLFLKRGELYFQHQDFEESVSDFNACIDLGYDSPRLDFGFAKSFDRLENFEASLRHLDKILGNDAQNVRALRLKGKVLGKAGRFFESGVCFEKVIEYSEKTFTENYMEASLAWEKCGGEDWLQKATGSIEQGITDLGELLVFYKRLIELHLTVKDYDAALACQTKIIEKSNRKERAFYDRALIYLKKGDKLTGRSDLENSKKAIEKLPPRIKNNRAVLDLKSSIHDVLKMMGDE